MLGVCHLRWFEQCRQLSHQHDQLDHQSVSSCSHNGPSITELTFHVDSFGFTVWQTTLLGIVSGAIEILTIWSSVLVIKKFPNARGYVGASYSIPNIVSGILLVALPWAAKGALLLPSIWAVWVHLVSYFLCHGVQLPTLGTRRRLLQTRCVLSDTVSLLSVEL